MPILTTAERLGTEIDGKYTLHAVLGQGGMGVVFDATHKLTQRRVALKVLRADLAALDPTPDVRFIVEARITTRLAHPHVVQMLDMGRTQDGVPYLVMEFLEGRTLKDELLAHGVIAPGALIAMLLPVIGAMAVAHDQGVVHRDLKPANILLGRDAIGRMVPKVLDFGIAKLVEETGVTHSGAVLGTPHYLSPEQALGEAEVGPAADIWAMGVILYECLCGHVPYQGREVGPLLRRIANEPVPRLQAAGVSTGLCAAVERALRREPEARYSNMRELARALLLTAHAAGIALPSAPDPIGLRDWDHWRAQLASDPQTTFDAVSERARPENDVVVSVEPAAEEHRVVRRAVLLTSLVLLCVLAFKAYSHFFAAPPAIHESPVALLPEAEPPPSAAAQVQASPAAPPAMPVQEQISPSPSAAAVPVDGKRTAKPHLRSRASVKSAPAAHTPTPTVPARAADRMIHSW